MLTIHDCTFDVRVTGWGPLTSLAEVVAFDLVLDLLRMSPEHVQRIARTPRELARQRQAAMANMANKAARRDKRMPQGCDIIVEVVACPKE